MKSSRSAHASETTRAGGLMEAWVRFWFEPADPVGLHVLRLLAGLLFLGWLLPFAGSLENMFGLQGWFDQQPYADMARIQADIEAGNPQESIPFVPGWSVLYLCGVNARLLTLVYWGTVGVLVLFTLGICVRVTAALTWVLIVSFSVNPAIQAEADSLLGILAFYLMIGYVFLGQGCPGQSLGSRLLGSRSSWLLGGWGDSAAPATPSVAANLALRLVQIHLAVVLVATGLHKLQFGDWWAGVAFWYPLYPPLETTLRQVQSVKADAELYLFFLSLGAYIALAWQIGFPLFAWRPGWRLVVLGGGALTWVGAAFLYRQPWFGPVIFLGCLSFVSAAEWRWLIARLPLLSSRREVPVAERAKTGSMVTLAQR